MQRDDGSVMSTAAGDHHGIRRAIATVCLSGMLEDKLDAAAAAGFDGVEIFEPDLIASSSTPAEVRMRCADLGLSIDLYQPFRDFDTALPDELAANLRRAEHKFDVMEELGADTVLVCSSVDANALDDTARIAEQFHVLAERAGRRGFRVAYEALAWGRHVNTWSQSWDVVRLGDHPSLGLCLDSFHVLSRTPQPDAIAAIADLPGEKIFFLQLADAPLMRMDVLQWSRHHRLFPGQGEFDLPLFVDHILTAGYSGPLSLEVFNDIFRQSAPVHTAVDALRSLLVLEESVARRSPATGEKFGLTSPPRVPTLSGHAFVELSAGAGAAAEVAGALTSFGFTQTGTHRTGRTQLWQQGDARILLNAAADAAADASEITSLGFDSDGKERLAARAATFLATPLPGDRLRDVGDSARRHRPALLRCGDDPAWMVAVRPSRGGGRRARGTGSCRDGVDPDRPRRAHPAVRLLRRSSVVLPRRAGPGPGQRHRVRRSFRPGPRPSAQRPFRIVSG